MADSSEKPFKESYADYNRILRTWFVAFGIGVPAALILKPETREVIACSRFAGFIVFSLIIGTVVQILVAILNKYVAWCNYHIELNNQKPKEQQAIIAKFIVGAASLTEHIWIDFVADIATGILFSVSISLLYMILL